MDIPVIGQQAGMNSTRYRSVIMETLTQLNNTNNMINAVKKQAEAVQDDKAKYDEQERLVMHLDTKAVMLMNIVATYEVAYQMAVTNEKMNAMAAASVIARKVN